MSDLLPGYLVLYICLEELEEAQLTADAIRRTARGSSPSFFRHMNDTCDMFCYFEFRHLIESRAST